jgi:Flp pilus assembly pilin Flp
MFNFLKSFVGADGGATGIEYAMLAALISLVVITGAAVISGNLEARTAAIIAVTATAP